MPILANHILLYVTQISCLKRTSQSFNLNILVYLMYDTKRYVAYTYFLILYNLHIFSKNNWIYICTIFSHVLSYIKEQVAIFRRVNTNTIINQKKILIYKKKTNESIWVNHESCYKFNISKSPSSSYLFSSLELHHLYLHKINGKPTKSNL